MSALDFPTLTCCVLFLALATGSSHVDRVDTKLGFSIELAGQVMKSTEMISIPAVLNLDWTRELFRAGPISHNSSCDQRIQKLKMLLAQQMVSMLHANLGTILSREDSEKIHTTLCEHEPDVCTYFPAYHSHNTTRPKRFIFTAGAALGAGMGAFGYWLYDKIAGNDATSAIKELREHQADIRSALSRQKSHILRISDSLQQVWSVTAKAIEEIGRIKEVISCSEDTLSTVIHSMPLFTMVPNQLHRAVNDLLAGRITPDLISYTHLKSLLKSSHHFKDTLYLLDESLFYQLSHTLPVEVNIDDSFMSFIIQAPRITLESTGLILEVGNFGIHNGDYVRRLNLPHYIGRFRSGDDTFVYVPIRRERCEMSPGIWLCGQHALDYTYDPTCIDSILRGGVEGCLWEAKKNYVDPDVMVTRSSIFTHTSQVTTTLFNLTRGGTSAKVIPADENSTHWWPLSAFDVLVIGHHHITGHRTDGHTPFFMINSYHYEAPLVDFGLVGDDLWKDVRGINSSMVKFSTDTNNLLSQHMEGMWTTTTTLIGTNGIVILLVITGIIGGFIYYKWSAKKSVSKTVIALADMRMSELEERHGLTLGNPHK